MRDSFASVALCLSMVTALVTASPVQAMETYASEQKGDVYASNLIGMNIYSAEKEWDGLENDDTVARNEEWNDIGEVNDVILSRNGSVRAVILGIGGFLGIGEKDVAIPLSQLKFVREKNETDSWFLVVNANKNSLEQLPTYQATTTRKSEKHSDKGKKSVSAKEINSDQTQKGTTDRWIAIEVTTIAAEKLKGAYLYSAKDEHIGEVDRVLTTSDDKLDKIILDVGGFLGLGEHRIAVKPAELTAKSDKEGDNVRVYIAATKAELEKRPTYNN